MRIVIQRVTYANVIVDNTIIGTIEKGFLLLVGIENDDNHEDIVWLCNKLNNLRVFNDENNKMNLSIQDIKGEFLVISQFTLFASTKKGNRPSFIKSANPDYAEELYNKFVYSLKEITNLKVETGKFGADMKINLLNDGPVTILIDSKNKE